MDREFLDRIVLGRQAVARPPVRKERLSPEEAEARAREKMRAILEMRESLHGPDARDAHDPFRP